MTLPPWIYPIALLEVAAWIFLVRYFRIRPEDMLPTAFMVQYFGAGVVYFIFGKPWNGVYWAVFALGLSYIVVFRLRS